MGYRALAAGLALFTISFTQVTAQTRPVSCPETAQYYAKDSINVVTFGASTIEGVKGLNFQDYLKANFERCYDGKSVNIYNYGIGGQTTGQGLERLNIALAGKTGFIVIDMGINDALSIIDRKLKIEETESNMRQIIQRSLAAGLVPIICTLQTINDTNSGRYRRANIVVDQLNKIYIKLAAEYKINLADINRFFKRDFSLYQDDLHPNAKGYRLMSYILFDTINRIIAKRFLQFTVNQNYPNPGFNKTTIDVILPDAQNLQIKIYDIQGRLVRTVIDDFLNSGIQSFDIDLSNMAPGIYIYKAIAGDGDYKVTKKMIVAH